jgi:TolB-like protein/tetratricopeptide (TPR) repeat protein
LRAFIAELKRRRVLRTALWYSGASVAVVEAANVFLPSFGAPTGLVPLLAILAVFGLPVAITLSWLFDVSTADAAHGASTRAWPRLLVVGVIAVVSLLGAFTVWNRRVSAAPEGSAAGQSEVADPAHVAILGFNAVGGDAQLAAFAANLQLRLIDALSAAASGGAAGSRRLRVVSHASIRPYSDGTVSTDSIRRTLNVGTILEGTVEPIGDGVRVRVRLIDTESGDQIRTSLAESRAGDRLALLDALGDTVLHLIRTELGTVVRDRMRLLETRSRVAFDYVVWGSQRLKDFEGAFAQKDFAEAERVLRDADSLFAEAERNDPVWIEPILERGRLTRRSIMLAKTQGAPDGAPQIRTGLAHAERALKLAPGDYRALELRGTLKNLQYQFARPPNLSAVAHLLDDAERDLRASLRGNPTPARALRTLSEIAGANGHTEQAIEYGKRAFDEDPYLDEVAFVLFRLSQYSLELGRDAESASWCEQGRRRFNDAIFYDCRLALAAWSPDHGLKPDSAWQLVQSELATYPPPLRPILEPRLHGMVAAVLARQRMRDSAYVVLNQARSRSSGEGMFLVSAGVYGLLGANDSAFAVLSRMLTTSTTPRSALKRAPELRSLRSDPRFLQVLDR